MWPRTLRFGQVLLLGVLVRLALAPLGAHPFDTFVWYDTGQRVFAGQPFYGVTMYSYPPTWAGMLGVVDAVYRPLAAWFGAHPLTAPQVVRIMGRPLLLGSPLLVDWLFLLLVKLPLIVGDLVLGLVLRRVAALRLDDRNVADRAFAWYFLNPYVIWISAVWGMFDVLPTLLSMVAILLFLDRRDALSGITFGLAVSLKYFPVLLALALLVAYRGSLSRARLTQFAAGFLLVLGGVSLPFLLTNAGAYVRGVLSPTSGANVGRVSVWGLADSLGIGNVPLWLAAADIVATVALVALFSAIRGRHPPASVMPNLWIESSVVALSVFYVLNYAVNPQYFLWIIPFFVLSHLRTGRRPWALVLVSAFVLLYIVTGVQHYSFFLPIITISPTLVPYVLPMPDVPVLMAALGVLVWLVMLGVLVQSVSRAGGQVAIRRTIRELRGAFRRSRGPTPGNPGVR